MATFSTDTLNNISASLTEIHRVLQSISPNSLYKTLESKNITFEDWNTSVAYVGRCAEQLSSACEHVKTVIEQLKAESNDAKEYTDSVADTKLDKLTNDPGNTKVYTHNGAAQSQMQVSGNADPGTVPVRTSDGTVRTRTPKDDSDSTPKSYVDAVKLALENSISEINTALQGLGASLSLNNEDYKITLKNADGTVLSTIDLPLETVVVDGSYENGNITLTLKNGNTIVFPIDALVNGLVSSSTTINGKALTSDITLTPNDIGTYSKEDIDAADDGKLDKFIATGNSYAYISKGDGTQGNMLVGTGTEAFSIVCRDSAGRISVPSAKYDLDAVPKSYVDRNDTLIRFALEEQTERVDVLYTLLENTIINDTSVEDTYTARVTAGGLPVVNNAPTTVHKIQGATVASRNILDESQLLPWTLPAEGTEDSKTVPFTIAAGEYELDMSLTNTSGETPTPGGVYYVYLRDADNQTVIDVSSFVSYTPNQNAYFSVTEAQAQRITNLYISFNHIAEAGLSGATVDSFFLHTILSAEDNSMPYEAYYAGVKQAYFKGIVSTGRNLITSLVTQSFSSNGVTVTLDAENGTVTINGSPDGNAAAGRISPNFYLPKGTYTLYTPHRTMRFVGWLIRDLNNKTAGKIDWAWDGGVKSNTFTVTKAGYYFLYMYTPNGYNTSFDNYVETPMLLPGEVTSDFPTFELYKEDTYFALSEPVQLGKWDYIDVDNQKKHVQTSTLTKETPFTDEELAQYSEYVISADRKTVAYKTETETETGIGIRNWYTAYRGGLEMVKQGDTDNSAYGAENTITQNYYVIAGGGKA